MELGGTGSLDGPYVDGSGTRSQGGQWFSLMDKVYSAENLRQAFRRVQANGGSAGVDHETVEMFARHEEANLEKISRAGTERVSTGSGEAGMDTQSWQ
jgi:hypothetical protein